MSTYFRTGQAVIIGSLFYFLTFSIVDFSKRFNAGLQVQLATFAVMKLLIALLILLLQLNTLSAQKGYLIIASDPMNAVIRLDTNLVRSSSRVQSFSPGLYNVKAWSKGFELFTDTFRVIENKSRILKIKLKPTQEFQSYRAEKRVTVIKRISFVALPAIGMLVYRNINSDNYQNNIEELYRHSKDVFSYEQQYKTAVDPDEIRSLKQSWQSSRASYYNELEKNKQLVRRNNITLATGTALLLGGITWNILKKNPKFSQPQLLSGLTVCPSVNEHMKPQLTLNYLIK